MSDIQKLQEKLDKLIDQLRSLDTHGKERIRNLRIDSDMGDDYRENEAAKMAMVEHDVHYIRSMQIRREIAELRKKLISIKKTI